MRTGQSVMLLLVFLTLLVSPTEARAAAPFVSGLLAQLAGPEERLDELESCVCCCEGVLEPVCGADGRTWVNACEARCAGVEVVADGKCVEAADLHISVPPQRVEALLGRRETTAEVKAKILLRPKGKATGELVWRTREAGHVVLRALRGKRIFDARGELDHVEILFRRINGGLVVVTVSAAIESQEQLTFVALEEQVLLISFDATGRFRTH